MNGFLLLIPFFLIRFGLLSFLNKQALPRAAHFAPMRGREKAAYFVYQLTTAAIVLYPLFLSIEADFTMLFYAGVLCYVLGLCLCAASVTSFCFPDEKGLNTRGVIPFFPQPHVCGLFHLFYWGRHADPFPAPVQLCVDFPVLCPLNHSGGRTLVSGNLRPPLPAVHESCAALPVSFSNCLIAFPSAIFYNEARR